MNEYERLKRQRDEAIARQAREKAEMIVDDIIAEGVLIVARGPLVDRIAARLSRVGFVAGLVALLQCGGCKTVDTILDAIPTNAVPAVNTVPDVPEVTTPTTTATTTTTTVPPPAPATADDFAGVQAIGTDCRGWPVTAKLSSVTCKGGRITLAYDKANVWPAVGGVVANPHIIANGYDATWEWLKPGQTLKDMRGKSWAGHIKNSKLATFEPVVGQTYGFYVSTLCRDSRRNGNERSNVVWVKYE